MPGPKKRTRAKTVSYELIPFESEIGRPMYVRLEALLEAHHDELVGARIALAWCTSWKADVDGRVTLGKCKKASDLDRELAPFDFVILLSREFWQSPRVSTRQRDALLDHELMHAAVAYDEQGEPKVDERGRTVYRIRKHDLEEFAAIAARYGCYKRDLEEFAKALARGAQQDAWVGYSRVSEALKRLKLEVAPTVVATWTEAERFEVLSWAQLRLETEERSVSITLASDTMPVCLREAVGAPAA